MRLATLLGGLCALLIADQAFAQGIIIDRREPIPIRGSYAVDAVDIDAQLRKQVATVRVSHTVRNPGSGQIEAEYYLPLPADGAISSLTLMVDGKELPGKLMNKDEARRIYEDIVRSKKDPALLEYMGRGLYKTSVFPIPAGASRTVTLKYTQLCRKDRDTVAFSYPLGTQKVTTKPVKKLTVRVAIESDKPIKAVYSPTHRIGTHRPDDHHATVSYEQHDAVPRDDFVLYHSTQGGDLGATLLSYKPGEQEDGYFVLLASPALPKLDRKPEPKSVVFVIDRSGSMAGKKIEQAREAARFVVDHLNEGDTFNIIAYDDAVEQFKPEMQALSAETKQAAIAFINNLRDGGSTNIDAALTTAMGLLQDDGRPSYVLFLTDGLPTAGERDELKIADRCKSANQFGARLIVFGVGNDVNARLLDRLSHGNGGVSEFVKPNENLEAAVSRFAKRLTSPVLAGIAINLPGTTVNRDYPHRVPDLFDGGQVVWVGRYTKPGHTAINITGKVAGETRTFSFEGELAAHTDSAAYAFAEKLWALRRIGHIIDQIDLKGQNDELVDELVALSTKHGILTPYTSFLADENVRLAARRDNVRTATANMADAEQTSGEWGVAQREYKNAIMQNEQATADDALAAAGTRPVSAGKPTAGQNFGPSLGRSQQLVRNVGQRAFFQKKGVWQQSDLTEEQIASAVHVIMYSDAYFELARNLKRSENQYMNFTEDVLVELNGQVYRLRRSPPEAEKPEATG